MKAAREWYESASHHPMAATDAVLQIDTGSYDRKNRSIGYQLMVRVCLDGRIFAGCHQTRDNGLYGSASKMRAVGSVDEGKLVAMRMAEERIRKMRVAR